VLYNNVFSLTSNPRHTNKNYLNNVTKISASYYSSKSSIRHSNSQFAELHETRLDKQEKQTTPNSFYEKVSGNMIPYVLSFSESLRNISSFNTTTSSAAKSFIKYEKLLKDTLSSIKSPLSLKQQDKDEKLKLEKSILSQKPIESTPKTKPSNKSLDLKFQAWSSSSRKLQEEKIIKLCDSILKASSSLIRTILINDLFKVLYEEPDLRYVIYRERRSLIRNLITMRDNAKIDKEKNLVGNINECLSLLGYIDQTAIKNRGINILTLDGGGSKGFVTIEVLKNIEKQCGRPIHEIFDYISGVSTGAVLASLIGILKMPLDEVERLYSALTEELFKRNMTAGLGNLFKSYSYYDTQMWESMLQENLGDIKLISSSRDPNACKISIVSNVTTPNQMKVFLFRNYNLPPTAQSHYDGTCRYKLWESVRASSAAPGYYEDFKIDGYVFHDGGLLANNPTAIAIHEAKQIWPNANTNCIVSIGNGRFKPAGYASSKAESISLKQKITRIFSGISDVEVVHTMLLDTMKPSTYFRFNPYTTEEFQLDENRPEKWNMMQHETNMYMRRNDFKLKMLSKQLLKPKTNVQKIQEYFTKQKLSCGLWLSGSP